MNNSKININEADTTVQQPMKLTVIGSSQGTKKFAFIRIALEGAPTPTDSYNIVNQRLRRLYHEKALNRLKEYDVDGNRMVSEKANEKGNAALRFEVPYDMADDFLDEPFFGGLLKAFGKLIGAEVLFDPQAVVAQIDAPTPEELSTANKVTNDFLKNIMSRLDDPKVQQFLRSYWGNIKVYSTDTKGWEHVQYSPRNIAMIYAQFEPRGITPTFICSAREWMRCFNRKIKDGEKGVVIEVPLNNKRFDAMEYSNKTGGRDFTVDSRSHGATKLMASRAAFNQHDDVTGEPFYPGWVFDITQTELVQDANGNDLTDYFNDNTIQRPNNNLDLDQGYVVDTTQGKTIGQDASGNIINNIPLDVNEDKIPIGLQNIRSGMENPIFKGMFSQLVPMVENALKNPIQSNMENVISALVKKEVYQIDIKGGQKDSFIKIAVAIIMCGMGYGNIQQVAQYARRVQQERQYNSRIVKNLGNVVRDITRLLNGVIKEDIMKEQICKDYSMADIFDIFGIKNEEQTIQESVEDVRKKFNETLEKISKKY